MGVKGRAGTILDKLLPWGGLIGGALGAGLAHQIGSDSLFNNCQTASPSAVILACIIGLLLIGGGAFASWTAWSDKAAAPPRRLVALVSLMTAPLLAFAVLMPMAAALIIPPCHA